MLRAHEDWEYISRLRAHVSKTAGVIHFVVLWANVKNQGAEDPFAFENVILNFVSVRMYKLASMQYNS